MRQQVAELLVRDLINEPLDDDVIVITDSETGIDYFVAVGIANKKMTDSLITKVALNPAGIVCGCCKGSGKVK
jgi:hypothetical protein